jgi:hypothetical protein
MNNVKKMLLLSVGARLVTLFGIGWLLYAAWFVDHGIKTQGQVVAMKQITPSNRPDFYNAIFTFSDASGIIHTLTSDGRYDGSFKIGEKVTIIYDASNPAHSYIDSSDIWLSPLVLTLFAGFFSFVFGVRLKKLA